MCILETLFIVGPLSLTTTVGQGEVDSGLDVTALTCGVFSINGCSGQATLILSDGVYATATDMYLINLFSGKNHVDIFRFIKSHYNMQSIGNMI